MSQQGINSQAAVDGVAVDGVAAVAAEELVVAVAGDERVVAIAAVQRIIAAAADDRIVAAQSDERWRMRSSRSKRFPPQPKRFVSSGLRESFEPTGEAMVVAERQFPRLLLLGG